MKAWHRTFENNKSKILVLQKKIHTCNKNK